MNGPHAATLRHKLIDSAYGEAMLLAEHARGYFDTLGRDDRGALDPLTRVGFSCESLKVTTRLMHVIAWLLTQRAVDAGEIAASDALAPSRRLGEGPVSDLSTVAMMPDAARDLIDASIDLYRRVERLDAAQVAPVPTSSPARAMFERLATAL